jgi:uncharacterized protein
MNTNLFDYAFPFTGLFRRQAQTLQSAARQLQEVLRDLIAVPDKCVRISALVSEGDATCREIERELSLTFIEPLNRQDIRELNLAFQRTFQAVGAVSSRVGLYGFREIQKGAGAQSACLAEMAGEIDPLLEVVVRAGDGAANRERVRRLKKEADTFLLVGLGEIYESAGSSMENLLEALKWSQIYDRLEEAASCLEHTASVIEGIILKKV